MINPRLRPICVLTQPPISPPMMQPISALDTTNPSSESAALACAALPRFVNRGSTKYAFRLPTAPLITAVSYPKSSPPSVAINVSKTT